MGDLQKIFNPRTIAVVGATAEREDVRAGRPGKRPRYRVTGRSIPSIQTRKRSGKPLLAGIGAAPNRSDLAVIATPAATVSGIVDACGRAGVKGLIIISAGFLETGEAGKAPGRSSRSARPTA